MAGIEELYEERKKKADLLREHGADPYPARVPESLNIQHILMEFDVLEKQGGVRAIRGRIMGLRKQGALIFADLQDESGRMQILLKKGDVADFELLHKVLDVGDFLYVSGTMFTTRSGEKTIQAQDAMMLTKSLRPMPDQWYGLKDAEERYRRRYLDILMNEESRSAIRLRFSVVSEIRNQLRADGFLEVETPILQTVAGGATARPFVTHSNALDIDLYLRVAPELYLKRLLVAGFEKIFEIGRNFRNEGIDREHNPEFTMLELYWAYQDYEGMMHYVEGLIQRVLQAVDADNVTYMDKKIDFSSPWRRVSFRDLILEKTGIDIDTASADDLRAFLKNEGATFDENLSKYDLADEIFKKSVRADITDPVYVTQHPKDISPLAKIHPDDDTKTERFQLVLAGREVVNGFSELNDPRDQRERMERQEDLLRQGQEEVSRLDDDFIEALEHGMPPAAGIGIGMDRLAAIVANAHSLREVISFPLMKPRDDSHDTDE